MSTLAGLCERYSARVFIIEQRRANTGEARLLRLANNLYNSVDPQEVLSELAAVLLRYAPDERIRETLLSTAENWYWRRGHKYFLYEYELDISEKAVLEIPPLSFFTGADHEQRTTEHILPQDPDEQTQCWWSHFTREEHAALVHSLGNLVLTYDNSAYGRKCFKEKKGRHLAADMPPVKCYAQAPLRQEQRLALYSEWTPETITARQRELAEWAIRRWSVQSPNDAVIADEDAEIEPEGNDDDQLSRLALSGFDTGAPPLWGIIGD